MARRLSDMGGPALLDRLRHSNLFHFDLRFATHRKGQARERVDGYGRHDKDETKTGMDRETTFNAEGRAKEDVPHDQKDDVLEVVNPIVLQHQVEQAGQMGERDKDEVEGEGHQRMRQPLHHPAVDEHSKAGGSDRVRQVNGRAEREERGGHHYQHEVLNHVIAEVGSVKDADHRLRGDERDEETRIEERRSRAAPLAGSMRRQGVDQSRTHEQHQRHETEMPLIDMSPREWLHRH